MGQIAANQAIPPRFLEGILGQLKQAGFVDSRRGKAGGYFLTRPPAMITIGEVIRFVQGPVVPVDCMSEAPREDCPFKGDCIFSTVWEKIRESVSDVYDSTTFQDLLDEAAKRTGTYVPAYSI